jgi:hypothetical protein
MRWINHKISNPTVDNIFELPIMAPLTGGIFDYIVLLNDGQDVAPELPHLAVILLDHSCTAVMGRSRLFLIPNSGWF